MKKVIAVLLMALLLLSCAACGSSESKPEAEISEPQEQMEEDARFAEADAIAADFEALFPEEYREDYTFNVQVDPYNDGTFAVLAQVDQESDDTDAAFTIVTEYYSKALEIAEQHNAVVSSYSMVVVNKGAPVGMYQTEDGVTYTLTINGQQTEIQAQ